MKEINTDTVEVGDVYKNYAALCKALDIIPKKSGKGRVMQKARISRILDYHTEGYKVIIDKIKPFIPESRAEKRDEIIDYAIKNILTFMSEMEDDYYAVGKKLFHEQLGLVDNDYSEFHRDKNSLKENLKIREMGTIVDWFNTTDGFLERIIYASFKKMSNDSIGTCRPCKMASIDGEHRMLNTVEENNINNAEVYIMDDWKMNKTQIVLHRRWFEFVDAVCNLLREKEVMSIQYYYSGYYIVRANAYFKLNKHIDKIATLEDKQDLKEKQQSYIMELTKDRSNRATYEDCKPIYSYRKGIYYITDSEKITKRLI